MHASVDEIISLDPNESHVVVVWLSYDEKFVVSELSKPKTVPIGCEIIEIITYFDPEMWRFNLQFNSISNEILLVYELVMMCPLWCYSTLKSPCQYLVANRCHKNTLRIMLMPFSMWSDHFTLSDAFNHREMLRMTFYRLHSCLVCCCFFHNFSIIEENKSVVISSIKQVCLKIIKLFYEVWLNWNHEQKMNRI